MVKDSDITTAFHKDGLVKIEWRNWDGIDKPEYYWSDGFHPNFARALAQDLINAADEADKYIIESKKETLIDLVQKRDALNAQIESLQKEL